MRTIRLLMFFLPAIIFTACNNDELLEPQDDEQIRFDITFAGENDNKLKVGTNFDYTSVWMNGDKIGVYIVKGYGGLQASSNYADNVEFTHNNGNWTTTTPIYYPNDGGKLNFYAYYPYDAGMTNPTAYTFNVPIAQIVYNYVKSDFLWAKLENVTKSNNAVALQFSHALAMIEIAISDKPHLQSSVVNLLEAVTDCTINLATQSITAGSTKNTIQMYSPHTINFTNYIHWALVPPQTMDMCFVWTKNNIPYTVTPATNVTLPSGTIKRYSTVQP